MHFRRSKFILSPLTQLLSLSLNFRPSKIRFNNWYHQQATEYHVWYPLGQKKKKKTCRFPDSFDGPPRRSITHHQSLALIVSLKGLSSFRGRQSSRIMQNDSATTFVFNRKVRSTRDHTYRSLTPFAHHLSLNLKEKLSSVPKCAPGLFRFSFSAT